MKAAICFVSLCLLAGCVSSEFAWKAGLKYNYDVRGRLMTGHTLISNQNAGIDVTYRLTVQLVSQNTVLMKPSNFKVIETNEEVEGGWRAGDFTEGSPTSIPSDLLKFLEAPFECTVARGVIVSLKVPKGMPTWAENIKRSQASHFTVDTVGSNLILEGNLNRNTNNIRNPESQDDMSGYFYEVMEQTIHGECETYYTISQTGPFQSTYQLQAQAQPELSPEVQQNQEGSSSTSAEDDINRQNNNSGEDSREYQEGELRWPKAFNTFCKPQDQIYEVNKIVNFTRCIQKAVLGYSSPSEFLGCRPGDNSCGSNWARVVNTRYLLCGTSRRSFSILEVRQQEQFAYGLRNTQKTYAGVVFNVTLNSVLPSTERLYTIQNPKVIDNLVYSFDPREQKLQREGLLEIATHPQQHIQQQDNDEYDEVQGDQADQEEYAGQHQSQIYRHTSGESVTGGRRSENIRNQLPLPPLKMAPLNPMLISPVTKNEMPNRVKVLLEEAYQAVGTPTDKESIAESETLSKLATISVIIRHMNYDDIFRMVQEINQHYHGKEQLIKFNFLLDCIAIAGTNPAILVLNKLIETEEVTGEQAAQLIMTYPAYIRHPTPELLNQIDQLVQSHIVQKQPQLKSTAVLAFSKLLYQACVNPRIKQARYPVAIYGQFCDELLVRSKYVPKFIDALKHALQGGEQSKHLVTLHLISLGIIGDPAVIPIVQEILDKSQDPFIKANAIYALKRLVVSREVENKNQEVESQYVPVDRSAKDVVTDKIVEKQVLPILVAVAFDRSEHHEVRIAAIQMLTYCTYADLTIWQQLAISTYAEHSQEIRSYIYSTLHGLANLERPLANMHWRMQQKAAAVLPLANPFVQGLAKSQNIFHSQVVPQLTSGEFFQLSYTGSRDSNIPNNIYFRNYYMFGNCGMGVNPLEFSIHGRSLSKLADVFLDQLMEQRPDERHPHPELQEIKNLLGITHRQMNGRPHAAIHMNIRNEMSRLFQFSSEDIQAYWQNIKIEGFMKLKRGINVNYQKVLQLAEHTIEMATSMGVPMVYKFRMPLMVSLRGEIKLVNQGMKDLQLHAHLHPVYSTKTHSKISFKVPYTGKKYQAGIQRHLTIEAPLRVSIRRAENKQVIVALTPMQLNQDRPQGTIDLVTYHQTPYTAIISDEFYPTIHPKGGKMEVVHSESQSPVYTSSQSFGQQAFGFLFNVEEKSDYREERESLAGWARFSKRFVGPLAFLNLGWKGAKDIKFAERKLVLDLERSRTKTFIVAVGAKRQEGSVEDFKLTPTVASDETSDSNDNQSDEVRQFSPKLTHLNTVDIGSDSSESSESAEHEKSDEVNRIAERKRTIVVVAVGKTHALPPIEQVSSVSNYMESGENNFQYVTQYIQQQGRIFVRFAAGDAANQAAELLQYSSSSSSVKAVLEALKKTPNNKAQQDVCVEFKGKFQGAHQANQNILVVLRKTLLNQPLVAYVDAELKYGTSCKSLQYYIQAEGRLRRGEKMTQWALKDSPQAQRCINDEKRGFYSSSICRWVSRNQASLFNKMNLKLKWNKLPLAVPNVTSYAEHLVKYMYFPTLSVNPVPEGKAERTTKSSKSLELLTTFSPDGEFFDLEVLKDDSRWELNDVKANKFIQAILPLSATVSVVRSAREAAFGIDAQRTCSMESNYFSTFDNVTSSFRRSAFNGCYHVMAKDCSGKTPMAVLVKHPGSSAMEVRVLLGGNTKIDVIPSSSANTHFIVKVNGQQKHLPYVQRNHQDQEAHSSDYIAKILEMPNIGVQIITNTIKVATDGKRVIIFNSDEFFNTTCGICGDSDGEKVADMRSPKNIPLSRGTLLVASYAYDAKDDQDTCKVDPRIQREIQQEESIGLSRRWVPRNYLQQGPQQPQQQQQQWLQQQQQQQVQQQQQSPNEDSSEEENSGIKEVHHRTYNDNKLCFSEWKVKACKSGYTPTSTQTRQVSHLCLQPSSKAAINNIEAQIQQNYQQSGSHLTSSVAERRTYSYAEAKNCRRSN